MGGNNSYDMIHGYIIGYYIHDFQKTSFCVARLDQPSLHRSPGIGEGRSERSQNEGKEMHTRITYGLEIFSSALLSRHHFVGVTKLLHGSRIEFAFIDGHISV